MVIHRLFVMWAQFREDGSKRKYSKRKERGPSATPSEGLPPSRFAPTAARPALPASLAGPLAAAIGR